MKAQNKIFEGIELRNGQAVMTLVIFTMVASLGGLLGFSYLALRETDASHELKRAEQSFYLSEAGVEDVTYRIMGGLQYSNSEMLTIDDFIVTTTVANVGSTKEVTGEGDVRSGIRSDRVILDTGAGISFLYGVQVGDDGITFENNAVITGSVYANGSITGAEQGSKITGDAIVAKATAAVADQSNETQDASFTFGRRVGTKDQIDAAQSFQVSVQNTLNFVSLHLKKFGSPSNLSVKIINDDGGSPGDDPGDIMAEGIIQTSQVSASAFTFLDVGLDVNPTLIPGQTYWIVTDAERDDDNYWIWGLDSGADYANGSPKWAKDWTKSGWTNIAGDLNFQIWLGGFDNFISDMIIGGVAKVNILTGSEIAGDVIAVSVDDSDMDANVVADSITNCSDDIERDASYNTLIDCVVNGTETTPIAVPDEPAPLAYPISDAQIQAWRDEAEAGDLISAGDYNPPDDTTTPIGPGVIEGDLILDNKETLVLAGTVWVKQNLDIGNGGKIVLAGSYGELSGTLLADGWGHFENNGQFKGSDTPGSYLIVLALAECRGGDQTSNCTHHNATLDLHNNATGAVFYAPNGLVNLHNGIKVTEVTARGLSLSPNAEVIYEQGIANLKFSAGPGGGYSIKRWKEVE
ncbi:MAG: choice-of-anchor R domain-containing protein [bacterium]|nr:choice-of-anchor R domain-containing protein [bacterium]